MASEKETDFAVIQLTFKENERDEKAGFQPENWPIMLATLASGKRVSLTAYFKESSLKTDGGFVKEWKRFVVQEKGFSMELGHSYTEFWNDTKHNVTKMKFCAKINFLDDALKFSDLTKQAEKHKATSWLHVIRIVDVDTGFTFSFILPCKRAYLHDTFF
jgi:hypothetical protein